MSGEGDDDGNVHRRLQRVGIKRAAPAPSSSSSSRDDGDEYDVHAPAPAPAAPLPPVKRERMDSGSESDSYDNNNRIAMQRVERNRAARAGAVPVGARQQRAPTAMRAGAAATGGATQGAAASPPVAQRPRAGGGGGIKNEGATSGVVPVLKVPDFLTRGDLSVDVLAEIERMYEPGYWDRDMKLENPALYLQDKEEEERVALARQGAFENPVSFKVISEMLKRHPVTQMDAATMGSELAYLAAIEPISRAYENSMLRKPRAGESPCCNGLGCQCNEWYDFVMVEFITPKQAANLARGEPRSPINGMCLLCLRKMATYTRCMAITTGATNSQNHIYQLHRNIVNRPGEHTYEFSLPISANSPYPIMQNVWGKYTHVKEAGGHEYLRQDGYPQCTETAEDTRPVFSRGTPQPKTPAAAAAAAPTASRPPQARPPRRQ